jgi:hypothetical protein
MAACDIGNLGAWPKRFFDDPHLLVLAPPAPPLRPDQDLAPHPPPVLKYVLKDVLYCPGTPSGRLQDEHALKIYEGLSTSLTLFGGVGTIFGTVIGSILIGVLINGLVLMNVNPYVQQITIGFILVAVVAFDQFAKSRRLK